MTITITEEDIRKFYEEDLAAHVETNTKFYAMVKKSFDLADIIQTFEDSYRIRCEQELKRYPAWVQESVDVRLAALGRLPESVYKRLEEEDKIKGLSAGADDYVTKPFSIPELMARVKANMRRAPEIITTKELFFEDIRMDLVAKKVYRGDNYIHLGPTEFRLLKMLMEEPRKVFSRDFLLKNVWGINIYVETRTVDVHIRRLRKSLNEFGPDYIRTVRASGYSIDNQPEEVSEVSD